MMKNRTLLLLIALFSAGLASAQQPASDKMDARLRLWISDRQELIRQQPALFKDGPVDDPMIPVIFRSAEGRSLAEKHNGHIFSEMGTIWTAEIPLSRMRSFASEAAVEKIESSQDVELHNDRAKTLVGADKVHACELPGGLGYTGMGVIVGIIDTGIDFLNADFRKRLDPSETRIYSIWDQTAGQGTQPADFAYGAEWTKAQINAELKKPGTVTERDSSGHGTHVTGTAAGIRGMAYDADIISVKTPLVSNGDYRFATSAKTLDAVNYIYKKAVALNKPAVVNMSLGFTFGAPHDGTSLFEQGIDFMVNSRSGFIVCASAGNERGSLGHHGGYPLTQDSVWTYVNTLNGATWYAASNSAFDDSIWVSVIVDSANASFTGSGILNQKSIFQTPWMKIKDLRNAAAGFTYDIIYGNGDTAGSVRMIAAPYDASRTEWYIYVRDRNVVSTATSPSKINLYKLAFKGAGTFHSWYQELNGLGVVVSNFGGATNARYKAGDDNYTVGIPATANNVLAVGAYINKANYTDIFGNVQTGLNTKKAASGAIAPFSSVGPTLDGRRKPEFSAPGLNVASSYSRHSEKDSTQMVDGNTVVFSGTSMSCPVAAGSVALYLQKYPKATFASLRAALDSNTSRKDVYVKSNGPLPNNYWGYGKLDIYKAMGGTWFTGIEEKDAPVNAVLVYPNPAAGTVTFILPEGMAGKTIQIYDINGRLVAGHSSASPVTDVSSFMPGVYFYTVSGSAETLKGKFIVNR